MLRLVVALVLLALSFGCKSVPDWYEPPMQRKPLQPSDSSRHFIVMSDPAADGYIVKDVARHVEGGTWRWAHKRPELRFYLPSNQHLTFHMDFTIAENTFKETGPVTLSWYINGAPFGKVRYDKPGEHHFEKPVPPEMLKPGAENTVAIEPDKVWTSKEDGVAFSFVLARVGFLE